MKSLSMHTTPTQRRFMVLRLAMKIKMYNKKCKYLSRLDRLKVNLLFSADL